MDMQVVAVTSDFLNWLSSPIRIGQIAYWKEKKKKKNFLKSPNTYTQKQTNKIPPPNKQNSPSANSNKGFVF